MSTLGPTPWDPKPYPPVPTWVDTVDHVKVLLLAMNLYTEKDMATLLIRYDQQALISQIPNVGGNPNVASALGVIYSQIRALIIIQGQLKIYKIQLDAWVANQPYYDNHPDEPHPFPIMPPEMLAYLAGTKT